MRTEEYQDTAAPTPDVLLSTTWYFYNCSVNVTRVVTHAAGSQNYSATRMVYGKNDKTVTHVLGETWTWNGVSSCPVATSYAVSYVREFRYDSGRARYMTRKLNPLNLLEVLPNTEIWSDYDGDNVYGDFTVSGSTATNARSYEPGVGYVGPWTNSGGSSTIYHHADHLGTLKRRTFPAGNPDGNQVYSAFGERLAGPATPDRYGYVGAHGYETHAEFPFLHVGARYYDPSSGRFLQRDPIGIRDGTNIHTYVRSVPTVQVDPSGLSRNSSPGDFKYFKEHRDQYPILLPPPPPPPPGSKEEMEQEKLENDVDAWIAGSGLSLMGCFLGGPAGVAIAALLIASGGYAIAPL